MRRWRPAGSFVDDSPRIRAVLRDLVEMDGRFPVIGEAADGEQAIRKAEQMRPDVMVLDVEMPILGGLDALPEITGAAADVEKASERLRPARRAGRGGDVARQGACTRDGKRLRA